MFVNLTFQLTFGVLPDERGFVKASVRDIVKAVGVTNSAIYNHFKNKDDLLYSIIKRLLDKYLDMIKIVESKYDHPLDRLKHMILEHTFYVKENREELKVFLEEQYQLSPKLRKKTLEKHRQIYETYLRNLVELGKMGLLRPVNKTVANFCIFSAINWAYRWYREGGELSIKDIANNIMDIIFKGILQHRR